MFSPEQMTEKKEKLLKYLDTMRKSEKDVLDLFLDDKITGASCPPFNGLIINPVSRAND